MDIPAGWEPIGDEVSTKLRRPCPQCGYEGMVVVQPIRCGVHRKMPTRCPECRLRFELPIKDYGSKSNLEPARSAARRRGTAWEPRDHQLFARYQWCCVYHEGSAEAHAFRLAEIRDRGLNANASEIAQPSLFASAKDLVAAPTVNPNLFGLVPDHVIPKALQELLDDRWTPPQRTLMAKEWIVAACSRCNGQRNQELESVQQLLYIFSRFVLPHRQGDEISRLRETFLFVEVLDAIERYRIEKGIEGPLRPLRLAR